MSHSDDNGLVLPPALAPIHIVIIPIAKTEEDQKEILAKSANKEFRKTAKYKAFNPVIKFLNTFEVDDLEMCYDKKGENHQFCVAAEEKNFIDKNNGKHYIDVPIKYGHIALAFDEVITHTLSEELGNIIKYMDRHGIAYGPQADKFKIQLIGGFCNFYLVEKLVYDKLHRNVTVKKEKDSRFIGELANSIERTMAVAYGTSLYANGQVTYGTNAQYTLGIEGLYNGTDLTIWSLPLGEKLVLDKPYLFKYPDGKATVISVGDITEFMYRWDEDDMKGMAIPLEDEYAKQLKMDNDKRYLIGIAQDHNRRVTVHCWDVTNARLKGKYDIVQQMLWDGESIPNVVESKAVNIGKILSAQKGGKATFLNNRGD